MKLNISSASKKVKLYQLCSSPNQIKIWAKFVAFLSTLPLNKIQYSTIEFKEKQQDDAEKVSLTNEIESPALPEISNLLKTDSNNNTKTTMKTTTSKISTTIQSMQRGGRTLVFQTQLPLDTTCHGRSRPNQETKCLLSSQIYRC